MNSVSELSRLMIKDVSLYVAKQYKDKLGAVDGGGSDYSGATVR